MGVLAPEKKAERRSAGFHTEFAQRVRPAFFGRISTRIDSPTNREEMLISVAFDKGNNATAFISKMSES